MAKTIGTSWTNIASYNWQPGTGFNITFYLDARYDNTKNSIDKNESYIYTRLTSVINQGYGSGYNYEFWCDYAPTVSGTNQWYFANETITEGGKSTIKHNSDGTKTIRINAGGRVNGVGLSFSMGEDVVLETIPRATKITNQTATIGEQIKISWTKASSNFRHKLTYSFGDIENEVLGENLVDDYTWEIPDDLYQYFTESPSAKGTLKLTTYNGDTQIGSTQEAELTINANQTLAEPVIEDINLKDINNVTVALTGDNTTFVLNKSNIFLTLSFNTRKFATIKSLSVNGQSINTNELGTGQQSQDGTMSYGLQYEYGVLTGNTIVFTITDTRGFTIIHTLTIADSTIIKYVPLDAVVNFKRVAPTTGEVGLEFNGNYFNGSFGEVTNDLTISYKYKKSNETEYSNEFTLIKDTDYKISENTFYSGNGSSKTQIKLAPNFDYKSQYDMQLTIKDKLTALPVINVIITKGIPIFWWNGEKVTINGDLYLADEDGNNPVNIKDSLDVVVDNLDDNATDKAPSQRAVKEALLDNYSTDEIVIGTWFGKPLYSKTFYRSVLINGTKETVNHGIQNVKQMWLNTTKSYIIWPATGQINNLPFIHQDAYANSIWIHDFNSTNYTLTSGLNRSNLTGYITLEYTKTTD